MNSKISDMLKSSRTVEEIRNAFSLIMLEENAHELIKENFYDICKFIPELKLMNGFKQNNRYHIYDVLEHTLVVVKNTPSDLVVRLAALFHDVAKPLCYTEDERGGHFYGHDIKGVEVANNILTRLDYDNNIKKDVLELIKYHDYQLFLRDKPLIKLLKKIDNRLIDKLFMIKIADCLGQNPEYRSRLDEVYKAKQMIDGLMKGNKK